MPYKPLVPKKICKEHLVELGVCTPQLGKFSKLFPKGMLVTRANIIKAFDAEISVWWYVNRHLLCNVARPALDHWSKLFRVIQDQWVVKKNAIDKEFNEAIHVIRSEYHDICNDALVKRSACKMSLAKFNKITIKAQQRYRRLCKPAERVYQAKMKELTAEWYSMFSKLVYDTFVKHPDKIRRLM